MKNFKEKIIYTFLMYKKIFNSEDEYIKNMRNESINMINKNHLLNEEECKDLFEKYKLSFNKNHNNKSFITYKILKNYLLKINGFRIVFINGVYNKKYSYINEYIDILSNYFYLNKKNNFKKFYNKLINKNNIYNILNTAFIQEGIYINIPNNFIINEPIHIIYFSYYEHNNIIFNTRNLIVVGENSNVNIIEQYQSLNDNSIINNSLTEVYALSNSNIEYFKIQNDINSSLIDNTFFLQKKNSKCSIYTFSFKGKLIKNNLNISQDGQGITSYLRGITIGKFKESISHNTLINHKYPLCDSYELYNNIFADESNGIFNGKILIHKDAQKVNAFQEINNIILSDKARIKAIPQLEIFANDVKCSHGCTIGPLNKSILFYIRSRGLSEKKAKLLLINTFFEENIKYIKLYDLKNFILYLINEIINSINY
ncbi:MAG: Fe-S cluster assembly protein SufD [Candidatus Bostrichicola ureolyticus]|nr:MAG: Fe-S cluster assembly protein SufD [Candidatus Bostrichicola ureolyticus]